MVEPLLQTLGRYSLHTELGKGGFAAVYRATDTTLEREVALKILKPGWTDDPKAVERFMREAKLAARLKHPNIVTIFDVGQAEGRLFIAMELVPGRSLQRVVAEDGPLSWAHTLAILEQAASALDYAHKQGLVHRDIKPANLILDEHEAGERVHVVLTDFGLVRGAEQASLSAGSTGGLIGTPEYIAPEIWDGESATSASDIYALGCVAYYLLTGKILFGATTPMAVLKRHMEGPTFPAQWATDVPAGVEAVLRRALVKDQTQRPVTAGEWVAELMNCEQEVIAAQKWQAEAERTAQAALVAEAARKAKEAAEAKAKQEAEEQERQRQAALAAEKNTRRESEAATVVISVAPQPKENAPITSGGTPQATSSGSKAWIYALGAVVVTVIFVVLAVSSGKRVVPASAPAMLPAATIVEQPTDELLVTTLPVQSIDSGKKLRVGLVTDIGGVDDKSFNQSAWAGAQKAGTDFGMDVKFIESKRMEDYYKQMEGYEKNIDQFAAEGYDVIITVGFLMGDATAIKAKQYPNIKFAIVDNAYYPTKDYPPCPDTVKDCYADGGLTNVTSLTFQEDEASFLAGVVAGGITKSGTVCTVSGMEIPPVVRYVTGFQNGAKWINPNVKTLNVFIPSFTDSAIGKETANSMIDQGCDVVFGVGGDTGNGGLLAAKEKSLMAIGVDMDQYNTYPEVKDVLVTSAMKNVDTAVYDYLKAVSTQSDKAGILTANLRNGGVGLAPYHAWDSRVPDTVKAKVQAAINAFKSGSLTTGYTP